ncbi:MAG TPA: trehalose-phosphatase [Acidimicrobiales bacterium]|nr:trehalose-phosphatase [Acidimicrobiales bacterium]
MVPSSGDERLAALRSDPSRAGIFCDFDGTLSAIVDDPSQSRPVEGAVDVLAALARAYARVGVVSGRPADFLLRHLGPGPDAARDLTDAEHGTLLLAGLYGLEVVRDGEVVSTEEVRRWGPVLEEVIARLKEEAPDGVSVEGKGFTVVLHYRTRPELADEARALADRESERSELVVGEGRQSLELRPPLETSKGTVVAEAASGLAAVCFLGDDHGDLTAFDALDDLAEAGATTVRVGVESEEAPDELLERADVVVDGPDGVVELLRSLVPDDD